MIVPGGGFLLPSSRVPGDGYGWNWYLHNQHEDGEFRAPEVRDNFHCELCEMEKLSQKTDENLE